jgi:choline-sulfatase
LSGERPNILMIQADQLAAAALGAYGNESVLSPNIDALAADGVAFDRAYCNSPLCVPSRASMMTGELPSEIGVYDNAAELPATTPTFAHELRARGYRTTLAGRMHFIGPDQLHGFEERLMTDVYPADLGMVPDWRLGDDERIAWYHDAESVLSAGAAVATLQRDYDEEVLFRTTRELTEIARGADERPFLLVSSFIHPHDPYEPPREHWDRYEGVEIDAPRVPEVPPEALDSHTRRLLQMIELDHGSPPLETILRARRAYYACVSYIDDKVGKILATLRELGLAENTIVLFTADHGDMLGERGLWYKMAPFEGSARVPLIFSAPWLRSPRRVERTVSLVDLLPTLVEIAEGGVGSDPPPAAGPAPGDEATAGESLAGLLRGDQADSSADGHATIEYLAEGVRSPQLTLVKGTLKLVLCPGDPDLFFDLATDPDELHNLADDPDRQDALAEMRSELLAGRDLDDLARRVRESQARRRRVHAALSTGHPASWDHSPSDRSAQSYVRGDFWTAINGGRLRSS